MNDENSGAASLLRQLPSVDRLARDEAWGDTRERWGDAVVMDACRRALSRARKLLVAEGVEGGEPLLKRVLGASVQAEAQRIRLQPLQRVVNGSGVILHTNLGRAPLGDALLKEAHEMVAGATNLEIDLETGKRGVRADFVRARLAKICGAEDALIVNNNAAAVLLSLSALATDREVIVSRGELVQIGGGFRIPDVIVQGGARLCEVGTTNITSLDDVRAAINDETGALLRVHLSNFKVEGFASRPGTKELAGLKRADVPLIEDLGSGNLMEQLGGRRVKEPTPARVIADGADLVCFSGDKLLGGAQAGLIAGRRDLIQRLAKHPLMRALRADKFTCALLQVVLRTYELGRGADMAPWRQLRQTQVALLGRVEAFIEAHKLPRAEEVRPGHLGFAAVASEGEYGSGSMPGDTVPSAALQLVTPDLDGLAARLRRGSPPVIAAISSDRLLIDFLAIAPVDEPLLATALAPLTDTPPSAKVDGLEGGSQ